MESYNSKVKKYLSFSASTISDVDAENMLATERRAKIQIKKNIIAGKRVPISSKLSRIIAKRTLIKSTSAGNFLHIASYHTTTVGSSENN